MLQISKEIKRQTIRTAVMGIAVGVVILLIGFNAVIKNKKEAAEYQAIRQANNLHYSIDTLLLNLDTLAAVVVNSNGQVDHFEEVCESLIENDSEENSILSLQLAPNGVVTYIYPEEGNEAGKIDLFADPERKKEAELARNTGNTTLAGPYELLQGGYGAVARMPVYLKNDQGEREFWGFVIELLDIDAALKRAQLDTYVKDGYDYRCWRLDPNTGEKCVISQSTSANLNFPISIDIPMPNATWHFDVRPADGWISVKEFIYSVIFLLLCALTGAAISLHVAEQQQKKTTQKRNDLVKHSLDNIANSVAVFRIAEGRFEPVIANRQFLENANLTEEQHNQKNPEEFLRAIGYDEYVKKADGTIEARARSCDYEKEIRSMKTGKRTWVLVNCRRAVDEENHELLYVTITNIDQEKHKEKQLLMTEQKLADQIESGREWEYHAEHDALTGLLNRKAYERIAGVLNRKQTPLGFVLLDIDRFKDINDEFGHEIGDRMLEKAARILTESIRDHDYAFRFGGDEFALVLCNVGPEHAEFTAKRIRDMSGCMLQTTDGLPPASFSAGIYFSPAGLEESVYRNADEALYYTKKNGRAGCTIMDAAGAILLERHFRQTEDSESISGDYPDDETDTITDGLSFRAFLRRTEDFMRENPQEELALLHMDIKGFKAINDQVGYERGNLILKRISERLQSSTLKPLVISRGMADHFYILARRENVDLKAITHLCSQSLVIDNSTMLVTLHCGICYIEDRQSPARSLCDKARLAENAVDEGEGSCPYSIYTGKMKEDYIRKKEIISHLPSAIANKEFITWFQPIFDAKTQKIASAEALVRWIKTDGQVIPPDLFIPTLEENGQITMVDMIVRNYVQEVLEKRQAEGRPIVPVSVNLSRMDFYNEDALTMILNAVTNARVPAKYLRFEITESAFTLIPEQGLNSIRRLRELGARILIDDFGKGYSSLSSLAEQTFDYVKLDMSFVRQIGVNDRSEAIITAAINMVHLMNAAVIAEGVETKEQYEFLRSKDCDYIQGYYFSRPLSSEDFIKTLDTI